MQRLVNWVIAPCAIVITVLLCLLGYRRLYVQAPPRLTTSYQAVVLDNGQSFFGQIDDLRSPLLTLRSVYYIKNQVDPTTKNVTSILVKRGNEVHAPDYMVVNKQHVLFIEPVNAGSQVAKLIAERKAQGK